MFNLADLKQKLVLQEISALYKKQQRQFLEHVQVGAGEWAKAGGWRMEKMLWKD